MKDDSRKPTSDVAEELGVSTKTVRRRLNRMTKNYLDLFSIDWYPDASNDIMSAFHVQLKPDADPNTPNVLWQKHYPNTLFYWGFSNIPNSYLFLDLDADGERAARTPRKLGTGTSRAGSVAKHHLHRLHFPNMDRRNSISGQVPFFNQP